MEEEMWRQHSEDKRRRREEEAKRRRSEAARQERREGGGEDVELEGLDEVSRVLSSASHHHVLKIGQGATGEEVTSSSCLCPLISFFFNFALGTGEGGISPAGSPCSP